MVFTQYLSDGYIISIVIAVYALYYAFAYTKMYDGIYRRFGIPFNQTVFHATFFRLAGFFFFGIIPWILFSVHEVEFDFLTIGKGRLADTLFWAVICSLIAVAIAYINVKKSKKTAYPQFKIERWTAAYKGLTYTTWILYLIGYEFMFRGLLLFGIVEEFGKLPTIILNVVLYAFVHIPKGLKEVVGCLILGPILCLAALHTENIFAPIIIHISLCLSNEYFSIRKKTKMLTKKILN
ncbi:MAG: CPBP family intramembrane metalloprotease [Lentimicrobiaceae bacterium]|nr:CPBP family intramembrane metalloprotease [Lentimicrobiaceae bacterium]